MKKELTDIIENFKSIKLLIVGDAILDSYVITTPEKFCREAPVPVLNTIGYLHECGGAANTALNAAALGAETFFLTVTGEDAGAKQLIRLLRKHKVHTEYIVKDRSRRTIIKKRVMASSSILFRIDSGTTGVVAARCEQGLLQQLHELYRHVDAVLISDYESGVVSAAVIDAIQELGAEYPKPVIVDAKDPTRYKKIKPAAVKPNYEEALRVLQTEKVHGIARIQQLIRGRQDLLDSTGARLVAATLDADGVVLLERDKDPYVIGCVPKNDSRSIGAGDTFTTALSLCLASNVPGAIAADIAAAAAAVVMQKEGTARCSNNELKNYLNEVPKHISSVEELARIVRELKRHEKKIVFTNGCFDILHTGHIYLLNSARKAGDILVVGVNSDVSIRKIKGEGRPINRFEDRITVLAGLQSVDYLIGFDDETPNELIKAIHPDVFVKGGNYTEESIPEGSLLKEIGCRINIVPYMEEQSTTHIIDKIREVQNSSDSVQKLLNVKS